MNHAYKVFEATTLPNIPQMIALLHFYSTLSASFEKTLKRNTSASYAEKERPDRPKSMFHLMA